MISKLAPPFGVIAALLLVGCGGQSTSSATRTAAAHTVAVAPTTATARRTIAKKLHGDVLGPRTSKAPDTLKDNEGPKKPKAHRPLAIRTYRISVTSRSTRVRAVNGADVGVVRLLPKTRQVCWQFHRLPTVVVRTAAFGRVRMVLRPESASIHAGTKNATGPVVAALYDRYVPRGCAAIAPVVLNSILAAPRLYYLSLGSAISPTGALRAQL